MDILKEEKSAVADGPVYGLEINSLHSIKQDRVLLFDLLPEADSTRMTMVIGYTDATRMTMVMIVDNC